LPAKNKRFGASFNWTNTDFVLFTCVSDGENRKTAAIMDYIVSAEDAAMCAVLLLNRKTISPPSV
jgi:hypothetical protein